MTGQFVISKAGHDREEIYIILEEKDEMYLLVNGKEKTVLKPKTKNRKHVTLLTKKLSSDQIEILNRKNNEADLLVKREIRIYKKKG